MRRRSRRADTRPRLRSKSSRRKKRLCASSRPNILRTRQIYPVRSRFTRQPSIPAKPDVDSAKAQLDTALLNLSYCHIVAPVDGIASQRSAEIGGRISQGQQLIVVVQIDNVWTTANFKETQLRKMHVGQRVTIEVDSLDESFDGEVENMPAATGDRSSLFPPENATGNYVKIVQRLPVRIRFNPNQRDLDKLRPGMSVEPPKVHLD
jgi:membrane fusion protein, multidrug efflux system